MAVGQRNIRQLKLTPQIAGNGADPVAELCDDSLERLGTLAKEANVDTRGSWENPME